MPRKVMVVAGPSNFSIATGNPRLLQILSIVLTAVVQCSTRRGAKILFLHFGSYLRNQVSYDHVAGTVMILYPY